MRKVPISSIADVTAGQGAPKPDEFSDDGIPFVRAGSLEDLIAGKNESELELVPLETAKKRKLKLYSKGSILFAKSGMSATKDRIYVLQNPAYVVSHLAILTSKDNVHRNYLRLALKQFPPSSLIKDPAYPAIGLGEIQGYEIPVPEEINDQIRIAHLLGKVEGLIAQRKQHLQQLDNLLKGVFLELFGDPMRNAKGWDNPTFGTITSGMRNGLSPSKSGTNSGFVYTLSAITGNSFQEIFKEDIFSQIYDKYYPSTRDFLICRGNGNINLVGKGYFFPGNSKNVIFPDTIIAASILPNSVNRHFLEALWKTRFIRKQIENNARTTNGAHKINQSVLEKLKIILPAMEFQNQFGTIVEKIEALKSRYQQSLNDLESLYGALSQQAFKGELDLSRVQLPDADLLEPTEHVETPAEEPFAINLPDSDTPLATFICRDKRQSQLICWLDSYCQQIGNMPFSASDFLSIAQKRIVEIYPGNEFELGLDDYEQIKSWMFEHLKTGRLQQTQNITGKDENGKPILGNRIELKAGGQH